MLMFQRTELSRLPKRKDLERDGFYDGNPANLDPLTPQAAGKRYVAAMGGMEAVMRQAQSAFDYRPLFSETQHLYCAAGHPLFSLPEPDAAALAAGDLVEHPYRFLRNDLPLPNRVGSARSEQVEGTLAFILSGQHVGHLPEHFARSWQDQGLLKAIGQPQHSFEVAFHLARHRAQVPGEAQVAFEEDLLAAFDQ